MNVPVARSKIVAAVAHSFPGMRKAAGPPALAGTENFLGRYSAPHSWSRRAVPSQADHGWIVTMALQWTIRIDRRQRSFQPTLETKFAALPQADSGHIISIRLAPPQSIMRLSGARGQGNPERVRCLPLLSVSWIVS
jgi:hypothetical protein